MESHATLASTVAVPVCSVTMGVQATINSMTLQTVHTYGDSFVMDTGEMCVPV